MGSLEKRSISTWILQSHANPNYTEMSNIQTKHCIFPVQSLSKNFEMALQIMWPWHRAGLNWQLSSISFWSKQHSSRVAVPCNQKLYYKFHYSIHSAGDGTKVSNSQIIEATNLTTDFSASKLFAGNKNLACKMTVAQFKLNYDKRLIESASWINVYTLKVVFKHSSQWM